MKTIINSKLDYMNSDLKVVYHIATLKDFQHSCIKNIYKPSNFDSDGFIHCTGEPETTLIVLGDYFQEVTDEILLTQIAIDKLSSTIKFEKPAPINGKGTNHVKEGLLFPHLYGALNLDSIVGAAIIEKMNETFIWPEKFVPLDQLINMP